MHVYWKHLNILRHIYNLHGFFFFYRAAQFAGSYFLDWGLNLGPQQWKCRILTTGLPRNSLFYFSICILNYLYFKPKFLERFTEVNGLIGLTEVRWCLPHFSFCKRKGMARGKLPSVHTATEQVQWGQACKKGAWEQGENKRHLEDQNRSLPVWSWVI